MKNRIITISNDFSFAYEKNKLFSMQDNFDDMVLERGNIYGIFGENGSGKTTFLNLLNSFLSPTTGKITYNFKNINYANEAYSKSKINYNLISNNIRRCFQVPLLIDELSTYNNIAIAKRLFEKETFLNTILFPDEFLQVEEIIDLLNRVDFKGNELAETLSYGQRRIISNLQVIYTNPQLIILDEPFSNLHYEIIEKLKKEYLKKRDNFNTTILIVEHTPNNLIGFADEIISIKNKQIFKS